MLDMVEGFNNQQFFNELNSLNPIAFRNRIISNYLPLTPNRSTQVDSLFSHYGY